MGTIVIVTGGPGTGKSYMASRLSGYIEGMTVLSYDQIKEKNFDRFGFDNKEQKEELNRFSLEEFFLILRKRMRLSTNLLTEYPFYQVHRKRLADLIEEYGYRAYTIYLYGDTKAIYDRGRKRDCEGGRHPGHLMIRYHKEDEKTEAPAFETKLTYPEFSRMLEAKNYNIMLGKTISVDVTDTSAIPYEQIAEQIMGEL